VKPDFLTMYRVIIPQMNSWLNNIGSLKKEEILRIMVNTWGWFPKQQVSILNGLPQVWY
jgi:hypothetical protein